MITTFLFVNYELNLKIHFMKKKEETNQVNKKTIVLLTQQWILE